MQTSKRITEVNILLFLSSLAGAEIKSCKKLTKNPCLTVMLEKTILTFMIQKGLISAKETKLHEHLMLTGFRMLSWIYTSSVTTKPNSFFNYLLKEIYELIEQTLPDYN